ncbi:MAG: hypothetical protein NT091_00050 [Candidatus Falkowbacteria bacterium]|nr:hypothetical protein [Candidatus Falkowbacteria bacterium]
MDLNRYQDEQGLTEQKMNFGLWFVRNRKKLLYVLIITLSLIGFLTWINTVYHFTVYFWKGAKQDEAIVKEGIDSNINTQSALNEGLPM